TRRGGHAGCSPIGTGLPLEAPRRTGRTGPVRSDRRARTVEIDARDEEPRAVSLGWARVRIARVAGVRLRTPGRPGHWWTSYQYHPPKTDPSHAGSGATQERPLKDDNP